MTPRGEQVTFKYAIDSGLAVGIQVGDRVRLKAKSQLTTGFGAAASAIGVVSGIAGLSITVDYPHVPLYTRLLPAADFLLADDEQRDQVQADRWRELVNLVDAGSTPVEATTELAALHENSAPDVVSTEESPGGASAPS